MSGNLFVDCIFLFLICYALVNLFYSLSDFLLHKFCRYPNRCFLVVSISHESESIECDIRCALSKSLKNKCALVVVCDGLSFQEYTVLWRLTDCYDHVVITTPEEISQKLDIAASISASL